MANKVEDLVNVILDSYNECDITARIDEENMLCLLYTSPSPRD